MLRMRRNRNCIPKNTCICAFADDALNYYVILLMSSEDKDSEKPDVGIDVDAFNGS